MFEELCVLLRLEAGFACTSVLFKQEQFGKLTAMPSKYLQNK